MRQVPKDGRSPLDEEETRVISSLPLLQDHCIGGSIAQKGGSYE